MQKINLNIPDQLYDAIEQLIAAQPAPPSRTAVICQALKEFPALQPYLKKEK